MDQSKWAMYCFSGNVVGNVMDFVSLFPKNNHRGEPSDLTLTPALKEFTPKHYINKRRQFGCSLKIPGDDMQQGRINISLLT